MSITKVAVIGAGSMGSGIAALCASAGMDVVLLDQNAEGAQRGVEIQLKRKGFHLPEFAERVRASDDYALLEDREWVIEAIFEDLGAKKKMSFLDEKNPVDSIVYVFVTDAIEEPKTEEAAAVEEPRPETFWERLLNLFR